MKIVKAFRHIEWWEYKLPPLLGIAYATLLFNNQNIFTQGLYILLALISLIAGAVYVSIINDIADIKDDAAAGKQNRMEKLPFFVKLLLPGICLITGLLFIIFLYWPDYLSCLFYSIPWIAFSMYSFKPIRLKNRGILGVLADASGAHIFTSLLMVSYMCFRTNQQVNTAWICLIGIWAACYGMRGILWHQFHDRENDIRAHIETFATKRNPQKFNNIEFIILSVEVSALLCILFLLNNFLVYAGFVLYLLVVFVRYRKLHRMPVIIIAPERPHQILLQDFAQVFFPVSILMYAAFTQSDGWIVLLIHLLLFPFRTLQVIKDLKNGLLGH